MSYEDLEVYNWSDGELADAASECQRGLGIIVEANRRLREAIYRLNEATTKQQQTTNNLTRHIFWLTMVLVFFGVVQIALLAVQVGPTLWGWLYK